MQGGGEPPSVGLVERGMQGGREPPAVGLVERDAGKSTVFTKRDFRGFISGIKAKELSLAEVREKAPKLKTDFDGYMWVI